jgi:CCR4-NOT transcription complex subunit 3
MSDLKKEIKKLQRFREDIMKWTSNPEVKDKTALSDSRRRIEVEMEKFKAFERESKTKPFSMMGLAMGGRMDAQEQKKQEKREPMEEFVDKLTQQCDEFRAEWESLNSKKKKTKSETTRLEELKKYADWHAFHLRSLEQVLRRLDNDMIDPDDLDVVIETLELYMEQYEDPDYYHDEDLYDQFNLDSDAVDDTYYKPSLEESSEENKATQQAATSSEPPRIREVPMTAAAKARAKKLAAREIEAAVTGGPVRPDYPDQNPPRPPRPQMPTVSPPPLPAPSNPPNRPAPIEPGLLPSSEPSLTESTNARITSTSVWGSETLPPISLDRQKSLLLSILDKSFMDRPLCEDAVRIRPYTPSNLYSHTIPNGRTAYPHRPVLKDDETLSAKVPFDTLQLMFYYREGSFPQLLAASELKDQNWRFHKKFGLWMERAGDGPKVSNPAFEFGTYDFFDLDQWSRKTKSVFTFEYEFLEEDGIISPRRPQPSSTTIQRPVEVQLQ